MSKKYLLAAVLALPLAVLAQSEPQLIGRYTELAGSKQNATSLVTGLRDGKEVRLANGRTVETFTPPTGKMGYGNIDNALALAQESLADQGITKPTPAQLEAALMGDKNLKLEGILQMRADGKGWGQIAQSLGFKLGDVKRSDHAPAKTERVSARAERAPRVAKVERPEKPERPERPEKPQRPEKPR